jgi:hypothetical protein
MILLSSCGSGVKMGRVDEIHKGDRLTSFSQEITSPIQDIQTKAASTYTLEIKVRNMGTQPWFGGGGPNAVDAGYRWLDDKGNILPVEGNRAQLNRPMVKPGEVDSLRLKVAAPHNPGPYTLWVSMVQEGVAWFFSEGSKPLVVHVTVT